MRATNISKGSFHLESGALAPGKEGEFTAKEYEFLLRQGRVSSVIMEIEQEEPEILTTAPESENKTAPIKKTVRKKKAAEQPTGFL